MLRSVGNLSLGKYFKKRLNESGLKSAGKNENQHALDKRGGNWRQSLYRRNDIINTIKSSLLPTA